MKSGRQEQVCNKCFIDKIRVVLYTGSTESALENWNYERITTMTDRTTIGQNIAFLRKQAGLTQTELADRLHVSHQAISQWERAETLPDILTLPALAEIFGKQVGVILGVEERDAAENGTELPAGETVPVEKTADTPTQQEYRPGMLEETGEYAVVLEKNGEKVAEIPIDIQKQIIVVLEGNCRGLSSIFTTEIRGSVEGNASISGGANIGTYIGGNAAISGGANVSGNIEGKCGISGGATINGSVNGELTLSGGAAIGGCINGNATFSGQCTIAGCVNDGNVITDSDLTIGGNVEGNIEVHEGNNVTVTVQGDVNGDVSCGDLAVGGSIAGDVDGRDMTVGGDIAGDVDGGNMTVGGDIAGDVDCGNLEVHGDIAGDVDCGECHVEGDVDGDIDCSGCTVDGEVSGDVTCTACTINGDMEGDILSAETVTVNGDANGDITADTVKVYGTAPEYEDEDEED